MNRLRRTSHASKATIKRYIEAAKESGMAVAGFVARPDGSVRVFSRDEIEAEGYDAEAALKEFERDLDSGRRS